MNKKRLTSWIFGGVLTLTGVIMTILTRENAISEEATQTVPFALGLILILLGIVVVFSGYRQPKKEQSVRTLTMASLFAALCYVGFSFFRIDIPVGDSSTAFHLGNVFCVLAALFLGGMWGGLAGSVGMTIADLLIPAYITSAPKTFLLKLGIGLITGLLAHKVFHLSREGKRKIPLPVATAISCACGMGFNMVADPLLGYVYKLYVLGVPQDAAKIWAKMGAVTTAVNALVAVIAATVFYLALRPALKRTNLLPNL